MGRFFNANLNLPRPRAYQQVMGLLNEFCGDVERVTNGQLTCALVPGFVTNLGQEWRVTVHSVPKNIDHILFRVHVPVGGVPTWLDFYEEQLVECLTADDVQQRLQAFAQSPVATETIQTLQ